MNSVNDSITPGATHNLFQSPFTTDLMLRTSDGLSIRATAAVLILNSPYMAKLLADGSPNQSEGLPVLHIAENSLTTCAVLHLCYPMSIPVQATLQAVAAGWLISALDKYGMRNAEDRLREVIAGSDWPQREPLRVYCIAVHYGWKNLMRIAAWEALRIPSEQWGRPSQLRMITALDYIHLTLYVERCGEAAHEFLRMKTDSNTGISWLEIDEPMPLLPESGLYTFETSVPAIAGVKCSGCSEFIGMQFGSPSTHIWMHDWLFGLINTLGRNVTAAPRTSLGTAFKQSLMERGKCESQSRYLVQVALELLEERLERAMRMIQLEIEEKY